MSKIATLETSECKTFTIIPRAIFYFKDNKEDIF